MATTDVWAEVDNSDDSEDWIDLTGDDLGTTESSTWKVEMYAATQEETP